MYMCVRVYDLFKFRCVNDVILTKFSLLAAPEIVKMTTPGAASDEIFIKITTFVF